MKREIVVSGSVHLDVFADSDLSFADGKDLPGRFVHSIGGTAFNVLSGLVEEGISPVFVSALPARSLVRIMVRNFLRDRQVECLLYSPSGCELPEPGFLSIRERGELRYAVTSTCVDHPSCRHWIAENFVRILRSIPGHYGYFDCNLHEDTIGHILLNAPHGARLFVSGVSEVKVRRLVSVVKLLKKKGVNVDERIHTVSLNDDEWKVVRGDAGVENPLEFLKAIWIITCGRGGVKVYIPNRKRKKGKVVWYPSLREVRNPSSSSGCGDVFFAGYIASVLKGLSLEEAVNRGQERAFRLLFRKEANTFDFSKCVEIFYLDSLTGVFSRKFFEDEKNWIVCSSCEFCVALLDADNFKRINDVYGHQKGDEVLRIFGRILRENLRSSDIIIRYGGEEFLIIFLPAVNTGEARMVVERIRRKVTSHPVLREVGFTFSAGIAKGRDLDRIVEVADRMLYRSKALGKNRTSVEEV